MGARRGLAILLGLGVVAIVLVALLKGRGPEGGKEPQSTSPAALPDKIEMVCTTCSRGITISAAEYEQKMKEPQPGEGKSVFICPGCGCRTVFRRDDLNRDRDLRSRTRKHKPIDD